MLHFSLKWVKRNTSRVWRFRFRDPPLEGQNLINGCFASLKPSDGIYSTTSLIRPFLLQSCYLDIVGRPFIVNHGVLVSKIKILKNQKYRAKFSSFQVLICIKKISSFVICNLIFLNKLFRSASFSVKSGECSLSDMDRFSVIARSAYQSAEGIEYFESNCVDDPVKMCDFQKTEGRILKTVDAVYQVNLPLLICISFAYANFIWIFLNLTSCKTWIFKLLKI